MNRCKVVVKNVVEICFAFFGLTLIGILLGITTILLYYQISYEIFMVLLFEVKKKISLD